MASDVFQDVDGAIRKLEPLLSGLKKSIDNLEASLINLGKSTKEVATSQEDLSNKTNSAKKATSDIDSVEKERLKLLDKLKKANSDRIQTNEELKVQLQQQNKINKTLAKDKLNLIGAYEKESKRLVELKKRYKDLAVAGKENSKEALKLNTEISKLDGKLKRIDKTVGNSQREVGNYSGALGKLKSGFIAITGAIAAARGAFKLTKDILESTQESGDRLTITVEGMKNGWEAFKKSIATGDLSDLVKNIRDAIKAGKEYAATIDDLSDRNRDLKITEAETRIEIERLKQTVDNVNLSNQERIEAAKEINKLELSILKQSQSVKEQAFQAEIKRLASVTGFQEDQILTFIKNYDEEKSIREDAIAFIKEEDRLRTQVSQNQVAVSRAYAQGNAELGKSYDENGKKLSDQLDALEKNTSDSVKAYAILYKSYAKTTDDELDKVVEKYVELQGAEQSFLSGTRRSNNQLNTITKQINKERVKNTEETNQEIQRLENESIQLQIKSKEARIETVATEEQELLNAYEDYLNERQRLKDEADQEDLESTRQTEEAKAELKKSIEESAIKIVSDRINSSIDNRLNSFLEANEAEQEILKDRLDKGLITEKEYEQKSKALKLNARQEEARAEKKKALFEIAINTLVAAVKALPNIPLSLLITGIGTAQGIAVAAEPIPKFRMGVEDFKGGLADVHSNELLKLSDGSMFKTPIGETRMYLPPQTDVIPAHKAEPIIKESESNIQQYKPQKQQPTQKIYTWTQKGLEYRDKIKKTRTIYLDRRIR